MANLSMDQRREILEASLAATDRDEKLRLMRLLPLAPHLARIGKELYGKNFLLEGGFNLSDANEEFGDGWLDR